MSERAPSADEIVNKLQSAIERWQHNDAEGDWSGAAEDLDAAYESLTLLLQHLLHNDADLLILSKEQAANLEWLARAGVKATTDHERAQQGYSQLRSLIMNHDQWTFLPDKDQ